MLPVSHIHYGDFVAYFSSPLRTLCCLFLISITDTVAWFSSPLDLANWTKSVFLGVKGGSNEIFTYLKVFREVISFTYQKILLGDRVPLKIWKKTIIKKFQIIFDFIQNRKKKYLYVGNGRSNLFSWSLTITEIRHAYLPSKLLKNLK